MSIENKNRKKPLRVVAPTAFAIGAVAAGVIGLETSAGSNKPSQPSAIVGKPYNLAPSNGEVWTPEQIKSAEAQAESDTLADITNRQPVNFLSGVAHVNQGEVDYHIVNPLVAEENGINLIGFFTNYPQNPNKPESVKYVVADTVVDWGPDQYNPTELKAGYSYSATFPASKDTAAGLPFDLDNPIGSNQQPLLDVNNNPIAIGAQESLHSPAINIPVEGTSANRLD